MAIPALLNRPLRSSGRDLLDTLARSDSPALVSDAAGRIVFWNRAAERLFGRSGAQSLGYRCHAVLAGRDVFGNRFCHEGCAVMHMARRGETVHGFELVTGAPSQPDQAVHVTVISVPGDRPEDLRLVHILDPIDGTSRIARALERLGAGTAEPPANGGPSARPTYSSTAAPLTPREREILRWVAAGLQNREIAAKLDIGLATVRNHVHNLLEKLEVHSKLEAVSLAFRNGWVNGRPADRGGSPSDGQTRMR
jgi:DNA-binding CsgD family transcriptional regulator